jgi:predicted transcriptional regulator
LEETEEESSRSTVKRAIKNLVKVGLLTKTGDGKKDSPYKFRLKEAPF